MKKKKKPEKPVAKYERIHQLIFQAKTEDEKKKWRLVLLALEERDAKLK